MEDFSKFNSFVAQFSQQHLENIKKIGRSFYLADQELWSMKENIKKDVFSVGLFLGEEKVRFEPSPALIELISKLPDAEHRKIYVNKKAEWLFLCGRSVLQESIAKNPYNLRDGSVLVQNEYDENLGFGYFKHEGKDLILRNLLDKGNYLRVEDKKGKKKHR